MTSTTETRPEPTVTQNSPPQAPQVAVNDIGSAEDFAAAVDSTIKYFNDGDIVEGTVVKVDRDEVLLDIGYKTEGVIPSRELSIKHDVDPHEVVTLGDHIEALVLQKEDKEGRLILSKKRAQYERAWGTIEQKKENDEVVEGTVIEVVKGGLILDIGLRGFLPASLVEMRRVRDLQPYVGRSLEAKIIELDKNRNNVVLSRRAWLEQTQSEVRTEFLNKLAKGQVRTGVVSSIVNFGAFVDLGGVDGLVHVSELSWKHIDHPSEVVEVGQEVTVEVLDVDLERERVSLSLKATQEDPWRQFARTHQIGQVVPGRVTKLVPFGAFVRVEEGIEGLVHISELAERHVEIPEQVVQVGQEIMVKVIDIDLERRRISLSLKQANESGSGEPQAFDPALYGMEAQYDEHGNYIYPEGFDPESGDWLPGYEKQREEWERQYAEAETRYKAHMKQAAEAVEAEAEAAGETSYSSSQQGAETSGGGGTLASDEALAALREKLAGGGGRS
jgi:small subunit ribosomal protein S1